MVYDIDIHQLNLGQFKKLKFFGWNFIENFVFLHLFNNECIIISFLKKKSQQYQRERKFIHGHYSMFFNFLLFGDVSWIINSSFYGCWKIVS